MDDMDNDPAMALLDAISALRSQSRYFKDRLDTLANSFAITGNTYMAKKLEDIGNDIEHLAAHVSSAHGRFLSHHVAETTQASTNIIRAALAGIEMAGRKANS